MAHLGAFKNMFEEIQDPATGGKPAQVIDLYGGSHCSAEETAISSALQHCSFYFRCREAKVLTICLLLLLSISPLPLPQRSPLEI